MTLSLPLMNATKVRGIMLMGVGLLLFFAVLLYCGMVGHLEALLGLNLSAVEAIIAAIISGATTGLPPGLVSLVTTLLNFLGAASGLLIAL
jgi:hypothetical protein